MEGTHFLKNRRLELGLSQFDLSLRLKTRGVNLAQTSISKWERGKYLPQFDETQLEALADVLDWELDQLRDALDSSQ